MIAAQEGLDEMARILLGEGKCKRELADKVTYNTNLYVCAQHLVFEQLTFKAHMPVMIVAFNSPGTAVLGSG